MENSIPSYLLSTAHYQERPGNVMKTKFTFLDRTIVNSANAVKSIYLQAENAAKKNFINQLNPHIKFISLVYFVTVVSVISNLNGQVLITGLVFLLYILARFNVFQVYRKIFFLAFVFGFIVVLPASLNIITPGKIVLNLFEFDKASKFWIYEIPENIGFTDNGFQVVFLVFFRVLNSVSLALLVVFTTPFSVFIKSFKLVGVPDTFLMIISLAHKYIFILSRTVGETYFALKSRLTGNIKNRNIRSLIGGRIFFIFKKSRIIYENTYYAMLSRGYSGKVKLYLKYRITSADIVSLITIVAGGILIILF